MRVKILPLEIKEDPKGSEKILNTELLKLVDKWIVDVKFLQDAVVILYTEKTKKE